MTLFVPRVLVPILLLLVSVPALAAECGDADASGEVTVTDGVQVLRGAAGLSTACSVEICDLDGSGNVSVSDGVNTLRKAAGLSVVADRCPARHPAACSPFTADCAPIPIPTGTRFDQTIFVLGGDVCSNKTPGGITAGSCSLLIGTGSPTGPSGTELQHGSMECNAGDHDGNVLMFSFAFDLASRTTNPDGSVSFDPPLGSSRAHGMCGNVHSGFLPSNVDRGSHLVIDRFCGVGETVTGSFSQDFELSDGSECHIDGAFRMFHSDR